MHTLMQVFIFVLVRWCGGAVVRLCVLPYIVFPYPCFMVEYLWDYFF